MGILRQILAKRLAPTPASADPTAILRPFDPAATGNLLGEGGGILVLEASESAAARGATPIAEVAGYAAAQCFCPDTVGAVIDPAGEEIAAAMRGAIDDAGIEPDAIDAIVPFGSGIPHLDAAEAAAIRAVFGARSASIPFVQVMPFIGNCGAGCGALSVAIAAQCLRTQTLPARLNSSATGFDADAAPSRRASLRTILVSTTSLGGQTAAIVLRAAH